MTYLAIVSRLYAHSKNYDMDLTLDYNVELFPLHQDDNFALALASSLARGGGATGAAEDGDDKERDVWRPDGKGHRGLEDDYDYVMYGKVVKLLSCCWRKQQINPDFSGLQIRWRNLRGRVRTSLSAFCIN